MKHKLIITFLIILVSGVLSVKSQTYKIYALNTTNDSIIDRVVEFKDTCDYIIACFIDSQILTKFKEKFKQKEFINPFKNKWVKLNDRIRFSIYYELEEINNIYILKVW